MNPEKQLELFKEARDFLEIGYSLVREALREGPVRFNREENITIWQAQVQMVDDVIPAIEAFIANDLVRLMEPGQATLTRKQIWRLYFLQRDEGINSYEDVEDAEYYSPPPTRSTRAKPRELTAEEREAQRRSYFRHNWETMIRERIQEEYWNRVSSIYRAFGIHTPAKRCGFRNDEDDNYTGAYGDHKCHQHANRFTSDWRCTRHTTDTTYKIRQAEWETYFGIIPGKFDSWIKVYWVNYNAAWPLLWDIVTEKYPFEYQPEEETTS